MNIRVATVNNLQIAIVEPRGSLIGGKETDELRARVQDLIEQGNKKLILDLGGIGYVNSSGIGALVALHTMYGKAGGKVKICNVGKAALNVFVITKLTSVFDVEETREAALKHFR